MDQIFGRIYAAVSAVVGSTDVAIQLKSPAEIAKLREANLVVAEVLDALRGGVQAGRHDLGAQRDRRRQAQGSSRRDLGVPRLPRLPGGALHVGQRGRGPRHPAPGRRAQGRRHPLHRLRLPSRTAGAATRRAPSPSARSTDDAQALIDATGSRSSGPSSSASRATGWGTSAGRCSPTSSRSAIRWCGSSSGTASAGPCTRSRTSRTTATPGKGRRLTAGLVVAIEPMVNAGSPEVDARRRRVDGCNQRWQPLRPFRALGRDHRGRPGGALAGRDELSMVSTSSLLFEYLQRIRAIGSVR